MGLEIAIFSLQPKNMHMAKIQKTLIVFLISNSFFNIVWAWNYILQIVFVYLNWFWLYVCANILYSIAITFWIIDGGLLFFATFIFHFLWSSVCGISIWTKQQWDVVMRRIVFNFKRNLKRNKELIEMSIFGYFLQPKKYNPFTLQFRLKVAL